MRRWWWIYDDEKDELECAWMARNGTLWRVAGGGKYPGRDAHLVCPVELPYVSEGKRTGKEMEIWGASDA